jgi:hypothetical protein
VPAGLLSPAIGLVLGWPPDDGTGGLELAAPGSGVEPPLSDGVGDGDGDVLGLVESGGDGETAGELAAGNGGVLPGCWSTGAAEQFTGFALDCVVPGELTGDSLRPVVLEVPEAPPPPPDGDPGVPTGELELLGKKLCGASKAT